MKYRRIFCFSLLLCTAFSFPSEAARSKKKRSMQRFGVAVVVPTVMGTEFGNFEGKPGFDVGASFGDSLFGNSTGLRASLKYREFDIRHTNLGMRQLYFMAGLIHRSKNRTFQLFASLDFGFVASWLHYGGAEDPQQNSAIDLTSQFRPGFTIPLVSSFAIEMATPISINWNREYFITWAASFGIEYTLGN